MTYFIGLLFLACAVGSKTDAAIGCMVFGTGLIIAAVAEYLKPKY